MTLEEVIRNQLESAGATFHDADALDMAIHDTATAVRAFLGSEEVVERVARAIDPEIWADDLPIPTRDAVNSFHARRQRSCEVARAALSSIGGE